MIYPIFIWTLAILFTAGVGGGVLYGVYLSYRDQYQLAARRKKLGVHPRR